MTMTMGCVDVVADDDDCDAAVDNDDDGTLKDGASDDIDEYKDGLGLEQVSGTGDEEKH